MSEQTPTPNTVQTGQKANRQTPYFEIAEDDDHSWHWMLWAANGRMMATNAIPYRLEKECLQAIRAVNRALQSGDLVIVRSTAP